MDALLYQPKEPGDFLWINKDRTSIRNNGHINSTLQSHVLRLHDRQERHARRKNLEIQVLSLYDFETRLVEDRKVQSGPRTQTISAVKEVELDTISYSRDDWSSSGPKGTQTMELTAPSKGIAIFNRLCLS